ncbi:MAG: D-glycero-alpha-D-manno-heptose-1,7-bisphosphate 7-phosphatase [Flavobacteriales bacterium]
MSLRPCLFLDRDGVINHDPGDYTKNLSEFTILPTVMEALTLAKNAGFEVVLITNQGGLAKGLYTHEDVADIHAHLKRVCEENGTPILDIFYSPHHPSTGKSLSRKPGSLMVERACAKHQLDPTRSWMVGDKQRDLDAAAPVGVRGVLIEPNAPLLDAVNFILNACS